MGSDDDATIRRDDAHEWGWFVDDSGRMSYEFTVHDLSSEALDVLWGRVAELPAGVEGENGEGDGPGEVDKSDGMRHDAAMTTTGELAVGPATGVLPLPMLDYIKWNHKAWGEGGGSGSGDGEVLPFDPEPGFWQTISEVGVPDSWRDPIREKRVEVEMDGVRKVELSYIPRVEELAPEATERGVPMLSGWDGIEALPETSPMPVLEPTQVLPVVKPAPPKVRGGQRAANARQRAAARARDKASGKDSGSDQG